MSPLQAQEGFVSSGLYLDVSDPQTICYIEEWQKSQALDRQIRSNHYTRLPALMEEAAEPPDLRISWIAELKSLDYIEAVRSADPA